MKKTLLITMILSLSSVIMAQSPFKGFFRPIVLDEHTSLKSLGSMTVYTPVWIFRPTIGITAMKYQVVSGDETFAVSSLQSLGTGISYQKIVIKDDLPYCQTAYNLLLLYNMDYTGKVPINLGIAATIGLYNNLVSAGIGWDRGQKNPFILLNISLNLNK
jgi:hypothetical protein